MVANPVFELFEDLCVELAAHNPRILNEDDINDGILEDIKDWFNETNGANAFKAALKEIERHFKERGASLPYSVDLPTREFTVTDPSFIDFIAFARSHRSVGGVDSKDFELRTMQRLRTRLTGDLRRVGYPRSKLKKKTEIVKYLVNIGFGKNCLESRDKDGGFDILWLPPLGAVPLRPVVSLQCKNSFFDESEANKSVGRAARTLNRHSHIPEHLKFVVFNDYIDRHRFENHARGWTFMPLGLTDLAALPDGVDLDDVL